MLGAEKLDEARANKLEQKIQIEPIKEQNSKDTIPQVNNYEETELIKYNKEDPMHNIYRKVGIEPNNYAKPEQLDSALRKKYNP